jgi:hypothetical protein
MLVEGVFEDWYGLEQSFSYVNIISCQGSARVTCTEQRLTQSFTYAFKLFLQLGGIRPSVA